MPRYVSTELDRLHSVELDCSDAAPHSEIVTWFKDGRQLDEGSRHSTSNNGAVLTVRDARRSDAGQYECRIVDGETGDVIGRRMFVVVEAGLCWRTGLHLISPHGIAMPNRCGFFFRLLSIFFSTPNLGGH